MASRMNNISTVATIIMYIRLSVEDEDVRTGCKEESNSITNQRMLMHEYIKTKPDLREAKIIEECDDGYSGKQFDRPAFQEMIELVRRGDADCIIVKDFSRFGRDYIETGNYLEQIFPFLGIRFISVNDRYDSASCPDQTLGLDMVFKNFVYDSYSRDLSKKAQDAWVKIGMEGSYRGTCAPYGYRKSKENYHKLEVNPETAPIVKEIFDLRLSGYNAAKIARLLNARGVPSPAQYAIEHNERRNGREVNPREQGWNSCSISRILRNEKYTGNMVTLRTKTDGIHGKMRTRDKQEWIRVEDTHEAIVSKETFYKVEDMLPKYKKPYAGRRANVFYCAYCGKRMSRSKNGTYYLCRYGDTNLNVSCYRFRADAPALENVVLQELNSHIQRFVALETCRKDQMKKQELEESDRKRYQKKLKLLEREKTELYEKYKDGRFSRDDYLIQKRECDTKVEEYRKLLSSRETETENSAGSAKNAERESVAELIQRHSELDTLTPEIQEAFIERVDVYSADRMKITWKFARVFGE
ncbi:MAG: recombinase family protein [Lachnospiraceae bacterium]|nr:recombinase family protein [Lachnospiraceae bacterium]